jgi:hypothetical protein
LKKNRIDISSTINKVTGGKPHGARRSSGGRRLILKAALEIQIFSPRQKTAVVNPSFSVSRRQ